MSKIISSRRASQLAKISKSTLINYVRNNDFPKPIENPKKLFLFWEHDVLHWVKTQKPIVQKKWNEKRYDEKNRTMQYIAQIESQLIFDHIVNP